MSKSFKHCVVSGLLFFSLAVLPTVSPAQLIDPAPCGGQDNDAVPCPVDGGLVLLIVAGIGYGAKKTRDKRKATTIKLS